MLKPKYILGNRYQVIKALGKGGQSNVYLLKDLRLKGKKWVAKEMVTQYADPRDQALARKHFEQEANLLATLEHVNLPKVIDYFSQGGKILPDHAISQGGRPGGHPGKAEKTLHRETGGRMGSANCNGSILPSQAEETGNIQGYKTFQHNDLYRSGQTY